ncbi:MAG TPA: FAD-binding oxidoreductase [Gaiellaceae bacterium]|jgi:FAD/FMN-containing dehydrogenase|nr:FAD-binding oxidoreductase [Gaiellaceae bacterium]
MSSKRPNIGVTGNLEALRDRLAGEIVLPGDGGWDAARQAWNLSVDQHPVSVVFPKAAEDVASVVEVAGRHGLRVAAQGTGHSAGPMGPLDETILVKTSRMRGVEIDAQANRARVGAGALWGEVVPAAAEHGLAALAGSAKDVGVVGYTLGGGIGWLARRHGLACSSVLAAEAVTADGLIVGADAEREPDLFWALRGGGGSFAIVTALEFALHAVEEVYAGALYWPLERAGEVLHAWRELVAAAPVELTSLGRLMQFPPVPEVPEPFRGRAFALVEAAYCGPEADGAALFQQLRSLGPELDTLATIPVEGLGELHMDPPQPVPFAGDGMLLAELPADAVDALVGIAGAGSGSPLLSVEVRHLGGALAKGSPSNGALSSIEAGFALYAVGVAMNAEMKAAVHAHAARVQDALAAWSAGRSFMNFTERHTDPGEFFDATTYERLRRVKADYDPDAVIRANHSISVA